MHALKNAPSLLGAYFRLALSMALVGSYVALSKPLVAVLPVFLLAWLRFGIGALAMPHWLIAPTGEAPMTPATRQLIFLESLLGNFLFSICMLYGLSLTSAVSAGLILATLPAVVALMSWFFLNERISPRVWAAIGFSVVGVALYALSKTELLTHTQQPLEANLAYKHELWGDLLVLAAVLCEAAYAVIGKKLTQALSAKRITALINLWGFALMTPLGLYVAWSFDFASVTPGHGLLLLFYALSASVGSVWLWMTGLQTVPSAQAGVFTVMLPISTASVGVFALGETLTAWTFFAFAISLSGVVMATLPSRSNHRVSQPT
jgi:drug/metabolite transporter (DMT)-like permease